MPTPSAVAEPVAEAYRHGIGQALNALLRLGAFAAGDHVVNLCAGAGIDNLAIAGRVGPAGRLIAVDADPVALGRLRELAAKHRLSGVVQPVTADVTTYRPPPGVTHLACAFGLHHLIAPAAVTRQWATAVPAGTSLLLLDWGPRGATVGDACAGLPPVHPIWQPVAASTVRFGMPEPYPPVATIVIRRLTCRSKKEL
ncbi:methyltransferase domain-containing protein [Actinoplanes sp. NPDC051411]|uniref:methyltransferase domain-containing protein n=1 Tax=Actinoplanes sp. NPDC051411 TaxID=3155522 RepID=UPI00343E78C4